MIPDNQAEAITPDHLTRLWYDVASRAAAKEDALREENGKLRQMNSSLRGQNTQLRLELEEARRKYATAVVRGLRTDERSTG